MCGAKKACAPIVAMNDGGFLLRNAVALTLRRTIATRDAPEGTATARGRSWTARDGPDVCHTARWHRGRWPRLRRLRSQANEQVEGAGVGHLWNYGANTWGWEDLHGGGDRDFNDLIVQLDFTSASGHGWLV